MAPAQELMQGERDFVRMRCAPGDDAFELEQIVGDGADLHQVGFDGLNVSHIETPAWHMSAPGDPCDGRWWRRCRAGKTGMGLCTPALKANIGSYPPSPEPPGLPPRRPLNPLDRKLWTNCSNSSSVKPPRIPSSRTTSVSDPMAVSVRRHLEVSKLAPDPSCTRRSDTARSGYVQDARGVAVIQLGTVCAGVLDLFQNAQGEQASCGLSRSSPAATRVRST